MPHKSTAMCRSFNRCKIVSIAARVTVGFIPRSISLAPISRITASVSSGTDQSSRARASEAVSPETPALMTVAASPFAANAACSRATKPSLSGKPRPAVSESPSATILIGLAPVSASAGAIEAAKTSAKRSATLQTAARTPWRNMTWRNILPPPYDLPREDGAGRSVEDMHDTLGLPFGGAAIALRGVNLSLGGGAARVHILRDINLNIGRGEAVALLGPSGSGKSTLLMVMTGLERAESGEVIVAGQDLTKLNEDDLARFRGSHVGIVFQAFHLIPTMTALENVAVPLELAGRRDANTRARAALEAVGLGHRVTHLPSRLSGGEQQRVAIARALAPHPAIFVADEPTGNLDETTGSHIIELLFRGKEQHRTTLVLVTHDAALAARCDRVLHMHSGRLAASPPQARAEQTTRPI